MWLRQVHGIVGGGLCQQIDLCDPRHGTDSPGVEESDWAFRPGVEILDAQKFHCLHPWFPSGDSLCKAYLRDDPNLPEWLCRFHKDIMKTFVFFFISVKFVVLARAPRQACRHGAHGAHLCPGRNAESVSSQHRRASTVPPSRSALNYSTRFGSALAQCILRRCGFGGWADNVPKNTFQTGGWADGMLVGCCTGAEVVL